jgi:hypothetical protein
MVLEILLGLLVLGEGYVIWNLNKKTELLETWVETFTDKITEVRDTLDEIDHRGHFEADDEVGTTFKMIKDTIDELQELQGEEVDAA